MRIAPIAVAAVALLAACDDVADPTVDTEFELPEGDIEPDLPTSDPDTTAAPDPAGGGPGQAPAPATSTP